MNSIYINSWMKFEKIKAKCRDHSFIRHEQCLVLFESILQLSSYIFWTPPKLVYKQIPWKRGPILNIIWEKKLTWIMCITSLWVRSNLGAWLLTNISNLWCTWQMGVEQKTRNILSHKKIFLHWSQKFNPLLKTFSSLNSNSFNRF